MKTTSFLRAAAAAALLLAAASAQAALQARDVFADPDHVVEAYYDDVLDVTWWADAGVGRDLTFQQANAFATSATVGGVTGWRLPTVQPVDPAHHGGTFSYDQSNAYGTDGTLDLGYNVDRVLSGARTGQVASELSYLYYVNLGRSAGEAVVGDVTYGGATFRDVQTGSTYWTGVTADDGMPSCAAGSSTGGCGWVFEMSMGVQDYYTKEQSGSVWLVHAGDVFALTTPVPEPQAGALMIAGLGLLSVYARRRRSDR